MFEPVCMDIKKLLHRTSLYLTCDYKHVPDYTKLKKEWKITRKEIRNYLKNLYMNKAVLKHYTNGTYFVLAKYKTLTDEAKYQAKVFVNAIRTNTRYYFMYKLFNYHPKNEIDDNDVDFDE